MADPRISEKAQISLAQVFYREDNHMHDPDDIERQLRELMLTGYDGSVRAELESILDGINERDCRISEMLDELLEEVDRLLLLMDELGLDDE
ncbi:hypothetical protein Mthe_0356 [Methanothrix thermoacetophila PT]|jgi:hypothetical protein|uniref:Uncharacterized protein n=2 Tax=Methanotrichaceae TaxID=143067 RepID=A0B625_METTP|nr:hypothetical protein Mthe_0356 [Methanothrix thermoacetophila PT]